MSDHRFSCILVAESNRFGKSAYDALIQNGGEVDAVWCQSSAGFVTFPSFLNFLKSEQKRFANTFALLLKRNQTRVIPINWPFDENLNTNLAEAHRADFILVAGSGIIFPRSFLDALQIPIINIHPTLLPAYRGPSPIQALVLNDDADRFGGITAHLLVPQIDAGAIIMQIPVALSDYKSSNDWQSAIYKQCQTLISKGILPYLDGDIKPVAQDESKASYFSLEHVPTFISLAMTLKHAENFAQKAPMLFANTKLRYVDGAGKPKSTRVIGLPTRLGEVTGLPPKLGYKVIELDLSDARVQFKISHRVRRLRAKISRLLS